MNRAFEQLSGLHLSDFAENSRWSFLSIEHENTLKSLVLQAVLGSIMESFIMPITCSDNSVKSVKWNIMLLHDENNSETRAVVFGIETGVPERGMNIEAVEERYRIFFENTGVSMSILREDTIITLVNREFEILSGYSREQIEGKMSWADFVPDPVEKERMMEYHRLRRIDSDLSPKAYDARLMTGDGRMIDVTIRVTMIPGTTYSLASMLDMTERRLAEEKFMKIFMSSPDCIAISQLADGLILDVNTGFERITGWKRHEVIGRTSFAINVWADSADREKMAADLKAGRDIIHREFQFRRKNGSIRDGVYSARTIKIGEEMCLLLILNDITESKLADKKFKELASLHQTVLDTVSVGLVFTKDRKIQWANNSCRLLFGYELNEFINKDTSMLYVSNDDYQKFGQESYPFLEKGEIYSSEAVYRKKNGSTFYALVIGKALDPGNMSQGQVWMITDVTERKKSEEAVRQSEEKFSKAFKAAPESISIASLKDGRFIDVNDVFLKVSGFTREEVIGKTSGELNIWVTPEERQRYISELTDRGFLKNFELRFRSSSGEVRDFVASSEIIELEGEKCSLNFMIDITEPKKSEQKFKQLADLHRTVLDTVLAGIMYVKDRKIQWVNDACTKIYGFDNEEFIGQDTSILYTNYEDYLKIGNEAYEHLARGEFYNIELPGKKKDGTMFWGNLGGRAINPVDLSEGSIWIVQDITERKKKDQKFKELADLHRTVIDTVLAGIIYVKDRKIQWVNDTCSKIFNYINGELIGRETSVFYYNYEDYIKIGNEAYEHLARGESYFIELLGKKKDGTMFWCNLTGRAINPKDFSEGSIWMTQEITDRKKAELELQKNEEILSKIVENMPNMIFLKDAETLKFVKFNRAGEQLLGYSREEFIGKSDHDFFPSEEADFFTAMDRKAIAENKHIDIPEETIRNRAGEERLLHTQKIPILDEEGKPRYLFGISEDITERKRAEEFIHNSLKEKEVLLKELYHRTKNNMQVICSLLELKSGSVHDPEFHEIITDIYSKIQTMALVHQKLYESQDLVNINLQEFVNSLSELILRSHSLGPGKLVIKQSVDDVPISIDTAMPLGMVLNELISNSIKHAFPGERGGEVKIEMHLTGGDMKLEYSDNGTGLPADFDPAASATLGMQIIHNISEKQLGGVIRFSHEKGFRCSVTIKNNLYEKRI